MSSSPQLALPLSARTTRLAPSRKKHQQQLSRNQEIKHRDGDAFLHRRTKQQQAQESPPHAPQPTKKSTLRARLSQLCKEGRLDAARRLLSDFLARGAPSPTLLWNTLLIGYVCNSLPHEALRLYSLMNSYADHQVQGCPVSDAYTYSSALKACADSRQLRLGKSIHGHIIRRSPSLTKNRVLNNSLLNMYVSTLDPESSCANAVHFLFDRMPKRNVVAWNTLIAWYVRCWRPDDALAQFRLMLEVGIRPTPVSFVNIFPAVTALENKDYCDLLYGLLVKCGRDHLNDQFVISSAVSAYSELSDIQSARRVFDQAEEKNTQVWNTMIGGYVQNGCYSEALALFVEILESDAVHSDTVTFLSSLMAVSQLQDLGLGQQIHAYLIKQNSSLLPLVLCNALLVMYSRCGEVHLAFELFQQMPQRDLVSWNTMVSAFVQNNFNFEGVLLVYEMQKDGFLVDSVTATALLSAASNLGSLKMGKETHGYIIRHEADFDGMESYLIGMYAKSGSVQIARRLFDGKKSDKVTWNSMIAGYSRSGQTEDAIAVFKDMLKESQTPNAITLASILPACSPVGGIQTGEEIHGFAIRHYFDNNVFVGTALVDMYSRCGQISFAERIFDGMAEKNTVTFTTMLSGLGQHGLGEKALTLFCSMKESGVRPDAVTFVALISACSYSGLVDEGLAVYEAMEEFGLVATLEHHCGVVDLLGRAGRVEDAYEFAKRLGDDGNFAEIWGSLLAACRVHCKFQLGELVADKLFELGEGKGFAGYHVLLSNVYAAERNWNNVDRVRKEMRERGLRKEPGSSWIEVGDSSHRFMSRDQMHPENDRIYAMLQGLVLEMKSPGYETLEPYLAHEFSDWD
ncbi:hypothetical protein Cni_G18256 [Canna indica]|uniref:Pentatricopeptide repeat-containing protein n=1 Tax=Canna indica TaxID=4628 RepID=A0AAQ3KLV9_9LILI|nr:hypothetical protein Cni_G18256 [Canna indica]